MVFGNDWAEAEKIDNEKEKTETRTRIRERINAGLVNGASKLVMQPVECKDEFASDSAEVGV